MAHSERALRRLQRRIGRDLRALERAGFDLASWGVDVYTNSVQVDLVTRRTDHAAFFRQRYGPVTTRVMATERTALECARADHFRHTDGGLEIHWGSGGSRVVERFEVVEHDDQVEVGVVERVSTTFDTSDYRPAHDRVALRAPLGDRVVVDAATGLRLRQQGPSPGEPACPAARQPSRLDEFIATRRSLGLPAGRAYARRMLRREDPFTKREWRYRSLREALEYDGRIEAYLRSHRDVDGGSSIVDRFPRRPLLVVRITARRALHEARLKQLARHPGLLRTIPATHTVDQLESIAARIRDDAGTRSGFVDAYGDAGFLVTWLNVSGGRVVVQLVTTRADAAVYFRERYGPVVRTRVLGDRHECA